MSPPRALTFRVYGKPLPLKRPRFSRRRVFDPSAGDKRAWLHLARPFLPAQPLRGPLSVQAVYAMPRPKSHFRQGRFRHLLRPQAPAMHQSVPDVDNLLKFSLDAMNTYFYGDDKQIVSVLARKTYAEAPENQPYTEIHMEEVPPLFPQTAGVVAAADGAAVDVAGGVDVADGAAADVVAGAADDEEDDDAAESVS